MGERFFIRLGVLVAVATVILCGVSLPAVAGEGYAGLSYLSSSGEFNSATESFSPDASGWKLFGGYNFNEYIGAELTYYDFGNFDETQDVNTFSADVAVYDLGFRGILPLGERFELFAKLGYSNVSIDSTLTGPLSTTTANASEWKLMYGLGAAMKLGKSFGLRLEYEGWDVEGQLQEYSLGAYYRFGKR